MHFATSILMEYILLYINSVTFTLVPEVNNKTYINLRYAQICSFRHLFNRAVIVCAIFACTVLVSAIFGCDFL